MFACVSNDDDDSVTGFSRRGGKKQVEQEDELINKVLEEGLRLKKRCKALTTALSDSETRALSQRDIDQKGYQETIFNLQQQVDQEASKLSSAHAIELAHLSDSKQREIEDLRR
jgi:dynactin complex subunit